LRKYVVLILTILVGFAVFATAGCGRKPVKSQTENKTGISVTVGYARTGDIPSVVDVSGDIKALKQTTLSAKMSGRIVSVPFREGDRVGAGSAVVMQDTSDLRAQAQQSQAMLESAQARLSQASTSAGVSDTQVEAQVAQAKAGLDAAKANLRMLKNGARTQERAQAGNAVTSAKANYENAKADLARMKGLYDQGALSPRQWDTVQMQYQIAESQYDSAKQQMSLIDAGAREEQLDAAQKQVTQASESLKLAETGRAQKALRLEDVKAAKAGVAQAKAALMYAQQQLANASIRTPYAGVVAARSAEPGQMASPGAPLVQIVALDTIYFEAQVSEMDVDRIKAGQPVVVTVDALPGRKFAGAVQKILPTAEVKTRQFTVRITVLNKTGELRPGMFARGSVEVARHRNVVIVPKDALIQNGDTQSMYLVRPSGKDLIAKLVHVVTRFQTRDDVEVTGVASGDQIVVVGQDKLSDGVKVNVAN
jgi:HlyD family secretion protein